MASKSTDDDGNEPSLELPSLRLPGRRRKKRASKEKPVAPPAEQPTAVPQPAPRGAPEKDYEAPPTAEPAYDEPAPAPRHPGPAKREFRLPRLPGRVAAVVTGAAVGLLGTVLTIGALAGCEAIKGTSTCGGPGLFLLVAILIVMILAGMALLKAWRVTDPGSTSFLAVGVVTVIAMVALLDVILSVWMLLVIPVLSAGAFALSEWVTSRFVEDEGAGVGPDVR